jgi:hypothetical protein
MKILPKVLNNFLVLVLDISSDLIILSDKRLEPLIVNMAKINGIDK